MSTLRGIGVGRFARRRGLRAALALVRASLVAVAVMTALPATALDEDEAQPEVPAPAPGDDPGRGGWPPGHRRGPPPIDRVLEEHAERLGLDAETRAAIRAIADASRETADAHRARLHELHAEMREILRHDTPDEAAVMRQADAIGAAETEERKHRLRTMLEIRALLTPAQREALVEIHEERHKHRKQRRPPHRD
jgi:Spy/CpxP family protein refolding chaperone